MPQRAQRPPISLPGKVEGESSPYLPTQATVRLRIAPIQSTTVEATDRLAEVQNCEWLWWCGSWFEAVCVETNTEYEQQSFNINRKFKH